MKRSSIRAQASVRKQIRDRRIFSTEARYTRENFAAQREVRQSVDVQRGILLVRKVDRIFDPFPPLIRLIDA